MFAGFRPGSDVAAVPQAPGPVRASSVPVDVFTIGPIWWSYHPSESSYMMTTAVLFQVGQRFQKVDRVDQERLLIQEDRSIPRGHPDRPPPSESLRRASCRRPTAVKKSCRSYWWFAGPAFPISAIEFGRVCA